MDWDKKIRKMMGLLLALDIFLVISLILNVFWKQEEFVGAEIPKINIELNGVSLSEINGGDKNVKYGGNKLILETNNEQVEFNDVEIKGRGNMSWGIDKKSYRIKFPRKINFLSQQKGKKIALISNGLDDTSLRNDLAHFLARTLDEKHPVNGDFAELFVDDEYIGLYYLVQPINIGKNGIDLRDSMGVLAELDNVYCEEEEWFYRTEAAQDCIAIKDVVEEGEEEEEAVRGFFDNYELFEKAVLKGDFKEAGLYADMESWAGYYLVGEFASNLDMAVTSLKMYQDGSADKIHAVLAWDFDWSFGNKNWDGTRDLRVLMMRYKMLFPEKENYKATGGDCRFIMEEGPEDAQEMLSVMMCYLVDMPEFRERVAELYQDKLRDKRQEIFDYIRKKAEYIREAAIRDNEKWEKRDFDEEVEYLLWWINKRFDYFDEVFGDSI